MRLLLALAGLALAVALQRTLGEVPANGAAPVAGGCELYLYRGQEALAGMLGWLVAWLTAVLLGLGLARLLPERWRPAGHLAWSLAFLAAALGPVPALRFAEVASALYLVLLLPVPRGVRSAMALAGVLAFLATGGVAILRLCPDLPRSFVALALLVKTFRRTLWVALEAREGRLERPEFLSFMLYFLGLHGAVGNGATPSFASWTRARGAVAGDGATTVAWCLGLAPLALTVLVMVGYAPGVRVFFPPCDAPRAGWEFLWPRFGLAFLADYLFLLATEQASVGVARLFGHGLRDNFDRPLLAPSVAEFWRRWNIFWREYLVAAFFYPVALDLARRAGGRRPWHLAVAAGVTFMWAWVLTMVPLALLGGAVPWDRMAPSLAAYYGLEALAVAWGLGREAGGARPWPTWVAVPVTFLFMAAARSFLAPEFTVTEQVEMLIRALTLR